MIKILLTPITFTVDIINMWTGLILSLILWDGKYIESVEDNKWKWSRLLWKSAAKN